MAIISGRWSESNLPASRMRGRILEQAGDPAFVEAGLATTHCPGQLAHAGQAPQAYANPAKPPRDARTNSSSDQKRNRMASPSTPESDDKPDSKKKAAAPAAKKASTAKKTSASKSVKKPAAKTPAKKSAAKKSTSKTARATKSRKNSKSGSKIASQPADGPKTTLSPRAPWPFPTRLEDAD